MNALLDVNDEYKAYRFNHPIKVCRNSNLVFSTYEDENGTTKIKCAFLGTYDDQLHSIKSVSFNSSDAATRYEHDSQSLRDLGLVKSGYFKENDELPIYDGIDEKYWPIGNNAKRRYMDGNIANFNSYDAMDKYVFVLDFPGRLM